MTTIPEYIPEPLKGMMQRQFSDSQNNALLVNFKNCGRLEAWEIQHNIQKGIDEGRFTWDDVRQEIERLMNKEKS